MQAHRSSCGVSPGVCVGLLSGIVVLTKYTKERQTKKKGLDWFREEDILCTEQANTAVFYV